MALADPYETRDLPYEPGGQKRRKIGYGTTKWGGQTSNVHVKGQDRAELVPCMIGGGT
jgi:hypothetical protein